MILVDACYRRPTLRPPIWFMRQAGRYLPEYRAIRKKYQFLEMCHQPEVVKEVTLQPVKRFDVDAAIIFSDILVPLVPMGLDLSFGEGEGPRISNPIRTLDDVARLKEPDLYGELDFLREALMVTRQALDPEKTLIGFAGAPFTLACYAVQGKGGNFDMMRRWMFQEPEAFDALMTRLTDMTLAYMQMQVESGAQVLQLFDSWGGLLSAYDYLTKVFPHIQRILNGLAGLSIPRILFIKGSSHYRDFLKIANCEVIGLDWTMPLETSRDILGDDFAVQGNLDPMILFSSKDIIRQRTLAMLELNHDRPGYIANLGHGIHKETPVENVKVFVDTVKNYRGNLR